MYGFQVHVKVDERRYAWQWVHPSGGEPYKYATREEAERMAYICYGNDPAVVRVKEIDNG